MNLENSDRRDVQALVQVISARPNPYNRIQCNKCGNTSPRLMAVTNATDPRNPPALICLNGGCGRRVIQTVECRSWCDPKFRRLSRDDVTSLQVGDELLFHRGLFVCCQRKIPGVYHAGIITKIDVNNEKVDLVQFGISHDNSTRIGVVEQADVDIFQCNCDTYAVDYMECYPSEFVIERARSRMGDKRHSYNRFNMFTNNCQSLTRWAKTGHALSEQSADIGQAYCIGFAGFLIRALTIGLLLLVEAIAPVSKEEETGWKRREAWISLAFALFWMLVLGFIVLRDRCQDHVGSLCEYNARVCCHRLCRRDCCAINCGLTAGIIVELFFAWIAPIIAVAVVQFRYPDHPNIIVILLGVLAGGYIIGYWFGFFIGRLVQQMFDCIFRPETSSCCCCGSTQPAKKSPYPHLAAVSDTGGYKGPCGFPYNQPRESFCSHVHILDAP